MRQEEHSLSRVLVCKYKDMSLDPYLSPHKNLEQQTVFICNPSPESTEEVGT